MNTFSWKNTALAATLALGSFGCNAPSPSSIASQANPTADCRRQSGKVIYISTACLAQRPGNEYQPVASVAAL